MGEHKILNSAQPTAARSIGMESANKDEIIALEHFQ